MSQSPSKRTGGWYVGATDEGYRRSHRSRSTVGNIMDGGFRGDVSRVTGRIMELSVEVEGLQRWEGWSTVRYNAMVGGGAGA
jgi:hypothetical protein